MTLSGHTSTLPRLVVQGHGFEASFLRWARVKYVPQVRRFITVAMTYIYILFLCAPTLAILATMRSSMSFLPWQWMSLPRRHRHVLAFNFIVHDTHWQLVHSSSFHMPRVPWHVLASCPLSAPLPAQQRCPPCGGIDHGVAAARAPLGWQLSPRGECGSCQGPLEADPGA